MMMRMKKKKEIKNDYLNELINNNEDDEDEITIKI